MEELIGTYEATRYRDEVQNFMVGHLEDYTTVKGPADNVLEPGSTYRFFGRWVTSPKYGKQFQFTVFVSHVPLNRVAIVKYLERTLRGTGIGKVTIERMWDEYQSDAVRILRTQPKAVSQALNIDIEKCRVAADRLQEHARSENTTVDLIGLFDGLGFPMSTVKACIDKWQAMAPALIRRDPFLLLTNRIPGSGFARCDTLYQRLGLNPSKLKRQTICLWHALVTRGTGDTWHRWTEAAELLRQKIGGCDVQAVKAAKLGKRAKWIATKKDSEGVGWLADGKSARSERDLVECIQLLSSAPSKWPTVTAALSEHQAEQVRIATSGAVGILSGTPGTGKTYSAAAIIKAVINGTHGKGGICVLALTGKAAVRATESLSKLGIEGLTATTIHRALGPDRNGHGSGDWGFRRNRSNPIESDFVIVDETSMVDTDLMASLVGALKPGTNLLLIGDPYQLPPVGHGAPFRDLIACGIPHGHLTEIQRNSGLIVKGCAAIREGRRVDVCERFDNEGNNLRIVSSSSPVKTMETIRNVFEAVVRKGERDPIEHIQVLVPMNEAGVLGRKKLNTILQGILNANGRTVKDNPWRVGDKVICMSNGWYPTGKSGLQEFLANGDIGRVVDVSIGLVVMQFPSIGDGIRQITLSIGSEWAKSFELAYAITVHKSQGSEWPVVIILADESAHRVCSREWWYTAVSRAKDRCLVIGQQSVMEKQARKQLLDKRKTFAVEIFMEEKEKWQRSESDIDQNNHDPSNQSQTASCDSLPSQSSSTPESNSLLVSSG